MSPSTATPMNDPAFDHAPCALLVLDPDGQALRVNRACRQLLAWSTDDALTGRHLSVLLRLEGTPGESLLPSRLLLAAVRDELPARGKASW